MAKKPRSEEKKNLRKDAPVKRTISALLADPELMAQIRDLASRGASLGTIEATIGLPKGRLKKWLDFGEHRPKSTYRILYNNFRRWVAEARSIAEEQMLVKSPGQWLERNSSSKVLDTPEEQQTALINQGPAINLLQLGAAQALDAMRILIESGHSVDEALRKDQIHIDTTQKDDKRTSP